MNKKTSILISIASLVFFVGFVLSYNAVDNSLTKEDLQYIPVYLNDVAPLPKNPAYEDELGYIISVQHSVLNVAKKNDGLPHGQRREPKELYIEKTGLCFDRSRVIEKILRYSGFETRHVSIYSKEETNSSIKSLLSRGIASHAVTEVLTKKGWLVVDSNSPWVSTDANAQPVSIKNIQLSAENVINIEWSKALPTSIYVKPFVFVLGLYSRHGNFYPPYNFIPDINYGEFVQNVL